jgi:hypothetical protein
MAFKGPAFVKTTWSFEERPVASSKLNTWDDRIEVALELIFFFLSQNWQGDGVIRGVTTNDLKVRAKITPGLAVRVAPGYALIKRFPFKLAVETETVDVTPPTVHHRIDLVQAQLATWNVSVKTGAESASPTAPNPDTDCIALAHLHLRPGMTSIKNVDDTINGFIADQRSFV